MKYYFTSNIKIMAVVFSLSILPLFALAAPHSVGSNIVDAKGIIYTVTAGGERRPYTSAASFLSYGFNSWAGVVKANSDDLFLPIGSFIPPQNGKIICSDRGGDRGTCYLISGGQRNAFPSAPIFGGLGFSFSRALYGDVSFMPQNSSFQNVNQPHSPGVLINSNNTVFYITEAGILGIPNIATFNSWGFNFADVVRANAADIALANAGTLWSRQAGELTPSSLGGGNSFVPNIFRLSLKVPNHVPRGSVFNVLASTEPGRQAKISFDWGDGNSDKPTDGTLTSAASTYRYINTGQYVITVTAVDSNGVSVSASKAVQVSDFNPEKLTVSSPANNEAVQAGTVKQIIWGLNSSTSTNVSIILYQKLSADKYTQYKTITNSVPNTGNYSWNVPSSLPSGVYFLYVSDPNTDYYFSHDLQADFYINNLNGDRDAQRLKDIRLFASALELYYNDYGMYPSSLSQIVPNYLTVMPVAPQPQDGTCSYDQNQYRYNSTNGSDYSLNFCLGGITGGYSAGSHILSYAGIQ